MQSIKTSAIEYVCFFQTRHRPCVLVLVVFRAATATLYQMVYIYTMMSAMTSAISLVSKKNARAALPPPPILPQTLRSGFILYLDNVGKILQWATKYPVHTAVCIMYYQCIPLSVSFNTICTAACKNHPYLLLLLLSSSPYPYPALPPTPAPLTCVSSSSGRVRFSGDGPKTRASALLFH